MRVVAHLTREDHGDVLAFRLDLDALSAGMKLTIPKLRQRDADAASAVASAPPRG